MKAKCFITAILSTAIALTMSASLSAETIKAEIESVDSSTNNFVLIFENQYVDEDGLTITDRIYMEDGIMALATSGTKTIKATKNIEDVYEMWVKGTFSWDSVNDTTTVSDTSYGGERLDSSINNEISNQRFTYASNQGSEDILGMGHKYAYVQYSLSMTNSSHYTKNYSLYLDVNTEGEKKITR